VSHRLFAALRQPLVPFALILLMGVGTVATGAHECLNAGGAGATPSSGSSHHEGHGSSPTSAPGLPVECSCIGTACHLAQVEVPRGPVVPASRWTVEIVASVGGAEQPARPPVPYLLPFAHAPPVL
jgi:hypothetical protein